MDFLDDDDEAKDRSQGEVDVSDLRRLSKLTELARLKDVDSSDESEKETSIKDEVDEGNQEEETQDENSNSNNIERKRELEDEETSNNNKKSKVEKATGKKDRKQQALELNDETEDGKIKDEPTITNEIVIPDDEQVSVDAVIENDDITSNADAGDEANEAEDEDDEASSKNEDNQEDETSHKEGDDELEADEADDDDDDDDNNNSNTNEQEQLEDQVDLNEQRKLAIEELISIESRFAELRDKLYQDKLNLLERELTLCLEGSHPELSKVYYKINGFYQDSLKLANSNLAYKLKCIDKETIATRTSIHQNFLKNLMDTKNQMITDTTSLWYKINKERNQLDQLVPAFNFAAMPDVSQASAPIEYDGGSGSFVAANAAQYNGSVYHDEALIPISKRAVKQNTLVELVHQRNSINEQLGVLNGLIQFHGFPVAVNSTLSEQESNPKTYPEELLLKRATDNEINDDLKAMGIST
ncbi:uncharacterized protein SPAPADRAFT_137097 [Spathaspora passalidarum NRRL Y-27907]|uniref:Transcriptional regulatory protein DEP1 n=1 Tax=Spathaspora passalidarum (strain NRRL Y-27907 / 11-Y1) TaxID=619300 RepID=G3AM89_SPAPN|nr:uncharacterized protein SPAPADRAFT_137097 [Spathaspora passalidarum NRRL Y-27907]EGW33387.1 hypothetical protein SPAPADRAFT_137097 [Spathaspora passalidarum NRRL Y-27907]